MLNEKEKRMLVNSYSNNLNAIQNVLSYCNSRFDNFSSECLSEVSDTSDLSIARWVAYEDLIGSGNTFEFLRSRIVQFMFPIAAGISATESYRKATLRGIFPDRLRHTAQSLHLHQPDRMKLAIHHGLAGRVPVLSIPHREDFENTVRALLYKNEPVTIPKSTGAVFISGLSNWDRIHDYRNKWFQNNPNAEANWLKEFQRNVLPNRSLYQDRLILLSSSNYSDTPAVESHICSDDWLTYSAHMQLEHACTHFFTKTVFGRIGNAIHNELIADYMGITKILGIFRSAWFLEFMGLADLQTYRRGRRFENHIPKAWLMQEEFRILAAMTVAASNNLEKFDKMIGKPSTVSDRKIRLLTLCSIDFITMSSPNGLDHLLNAYYQTCSTMNSPKVVG